MAGRPQIDGAKLRQLRNSRWMTQEDLAEVSGVDEIQISRLEREISKQPFFKTIKKLAQALEVHPDELMKSNEDFLTTEAKSSLRAFPEAMAV